MSKPKAGFYWCASCGGCEESVVDLAEFILDVVAAVDFVLFPVAMDFKREDVEAMADGEMTVCFINGAIRTSEQLEMAELCRKKSKLIIAYGSCSHQGGIPGLANLTDRESIMQFVYHDSPSTDNEAGTQPQAECRMPEGNLTLPTLDEYVKSLDQVIDVDYYLPGCPPPVLLLKGALLAVLSGQLPPRGSILAPDKALCDGCPRIETKPQDLAITEFKRPHQVAIEPDICLLAQGLLCQGSATRQGCDWVCINANMPCTGCMGPVSGVLDQGAASMSAMASLIKPDEEEEIDGILTGIPDAAGTFYRYSVPTSILFARKNSKSAH